MTVFLTIEKIERNTDCSFSTMSNQILTDSRGDPLNYFMSLPPVCSRGPVKRRSGEERFLAVGAVMNVNTWVRGGCNSWSINWYANGRWQEAAPRYYFCGHVLLCPLRETTCRRCRCRPFDGTWRTQKRPRRWRSHYHEPPEAYKLNGVK